MIDSNFRHEYKYLIDTHQMKMIYNRLICLMKLDFHSKEGFYNVSSLYFDDYDNSGYFDNENGKDPREKFRIRIYNHDTSRIVLECKRKERGKTHKQSCLISIEQYYQIINGSLLASNDNDPLVNKLSVLMTTRLLKPVVIVDYIRIPFVEELGNVRITFDTQLSSSQDIDKFLTGDYLKIPAFNDDTLVLEVKWDDFIPDYIFNAAQIENLIHCANSKYYLCRSIYF